MNKKLKAIFIATLTIALSSGTLYATESKDLSMYIGKEKTPFTDSTGYPRVENGSTLIPLHLISTALGYKVDWNQTTKKVTITKDSDKIVLTVGNKNAVVNGKTVAMDTKAQVYNNRTYIPLRFIGENMGATVEYKVVDGNKYVLITLPGGETIDIPSTDTGKLEGTAGSDHEANMDAIRDFFGENAHNKESGAPSYNPLGGALENSFIAVNKGSDCEVKITLYRWNVPSGASPEIAQMIATVKPVAKELFNFYLPSGGDKLYKILDDGYNNLWTENHNYLNTDIQKDLGSDGRTVVIEPQTTRIVVKIGYKK